MLPHLSPATWPSEPPKFGRFAATIVRSGDESLDDATLQGLIAKCRVALIGLPDDTGVELNRGRIGARDGPRAFRAALAKYGVAMPADETDDAPALARVFDAGDITPAADIHDTHDRISEGVAAIVRRGLLPVAIGGGHDLTFPFVRGVINALRERPGFPRQLHGTYLDAHLDVRTEVGSGMPFRSLLEGGFAANLTCIGLNPLVNSREHMEYFTSRSCRAVFNDATPPSTIADTHASFVSLDMDVFDSAYAPGVSALNPCGLSPPQIARLVHSAGVNPAVHCFDIMEFNPHHDADGRTARLAAHMFLTFLRGIAERDRSTKTPTNAGTPRR